jgi:hypothetical protein
MVCVYRYDSRAGVAEERPVGKYEAEGGFEVVDDGARLHTEDFCVDAAAVEAEDARQLQGWVC